MMSKRLLTWLPVSLLLVLPGLVIGCGQNVAEDADSQLAEEPIAAQPTDVAVEEPDPETTRERELAQRVVELETRLVNMESREANELEPEPQPAPPPEALDEPRVTQVPVAPEPRPEPQPIVRSVTVTIPAATRFQIEFLNSISSEESLVGDPVRAVVTQDVNQDGMLAIPADSVVSGSIAESAPAKKIGGRAHVTVNFDTLRLRSGENLPIQSSIEFSGKKQTGKDAATIGGSAAGGAILGRVLSKGDRDKGTVIGAVLGAAIGTAVASNNKTDPVIVEGGATTDLILYAPLTLTLIDPIASETYASYR